MKHALFLTYSGNVALAADLANWFTQDLAPLLQAESHGIVIDVFSPDPECNEVLFFGDDPDRPVLMVQISGDTITDISEALARAVGMDASVARCPFEGIATAAGMFEILETPVGGSSDARPRAAAMSFMVQYFGPTENDQAFAAHYAANHPPILAGFPGIRNVFCYVPVAWDNPGFPQSGVIVGNEVVFDDVRALNTALRSDVLADLRADSAGFPSFGHSTHHAMRRRLFSDRSGSTCVVNFT